METVALALHRDDLPVGEEAIEDRRRCRDVSKEVAPVLRRSIRRDHDRSLFVTTEEDFQEILGRGGTELLHSEVLEHQEICADELRDQLLSGLGRHDLQPHMRLQRGSAAVEAGWGRDEPVDEQEMTDEQLAAMQAAIDHLGVISAESGQLNYLLNLADLREMWDDKWMGVRYLFGCLITAILVSFGAPLLHDLTRLLLGLQKNWRGKPSTEQGA